MRAVLFAFGAIIAAAPAWAEDPCAKFTDALAYIRVPILIVHGADDQYGTLRQIEAAQEECYCPVDVAVLPGAGHSPHRDAPAVTLEKVSEFINRLLVDHHEGEIPANSGVAA